MKRIIITESQLKQLIRENLVGEMAYPSSWNLEVFKTIKSFSGRVKYCEQHLQRLSSGSSRIVYQIDDEKVLKLAKNQKGIAQNQNESDYYLQSNELFAKVFDVDDNGLWIEMELARKAKPSDFKKIIGYDFETIKAFIAWYANGYSRHQHIINQKYINIFDSEEFNEGFNNYNIFYDIEDYLGNYTIESIGDLQRISSWGVVKRDGEDALVLIDFGLTDDTYNSYYKK